MTATEKIINAICSRVSMINTVSHYSGLRAVDGLARYIHELHGMVLCLNSFCQDGRFYQIDVFADYVEFGFFDPADNWTSLKK